MKKRYARIWSLLVVGLLHSGTLFAQDPQVSPPLYTGSLGGGFALTSGNTDTQTFNLSGEVVRDPQTRNIIKGGFSYLRGINNDVLNIDRINVNIRDEYTLSGRTFLFGQMAYRRAPFQGVVFLWAPTGGIGHRLIDSETTQLEVSGGAGGVLERNSFAPSRKSGSVTAGQSFQYSLTGTTTFTQSISGLWKTNDFSDSLMDFAVGLNTAIAGNLELKIEFIDSYKNRPVPVTLLKNDTVFITSFLMSF